MRYDRFKKKGQFYDQVSFLADDEMLDTSVNHVFCLNEWIYDFFFSILYPFPPLVDYPDIALIIQDNF